MLGRKIAVNASKKLKNQIYGLWVVEIEFRGRRDGPRSAAKTAKSANF